MQRSINRQNVFITGGTSGLGLELVKLFLKEGYNVIATGRKMLDIPVSEDKFKLFLVDFSNLSQVAIQTKHICSTCDLSFIINNAGILSPPEFISTMDGLEYTFQVNYLSHLLINEIILRDIKGDQPVKIATVTSPVFRLADTDLNIQAGAKAYSAMKSYSSSKLYLTLMSEFLPLRYSNLNLCSFSFDPGTFSSGIYRMQKKWFRVAYRIASVFMRSPAKVANVLKDLLIREDSENGMIYYKTKHSRPVPVIDQKKKDGFMNASYDLIDPFLNLVNN